MDDDDCCHKLGKEAIHKMKSRLRCSSNGSTNIGAYCGQFIQHECTDSGPYLHKYEADERAALNDAIRDLYMKVNGEIVLNAGILEYPAAYEVPSHKQRTNLEDISLFQLVCLTKNVNLVDKYLRERVDPNETVGASDTGIFYGCSPMHLALMDLESKNTPQAIAIINMLLKYKANINSKNALGNTPFHVLLGQGHIDEQIFKLITQNGADDSAANNFGETPLETLIASGSTEDIQKYLSYGRQINLYNFISGMGCVGMLMHRRIGLISIFNNAASNFMQIDQRGRSLLHNAVSFYKLQETPKEIQLYYETLPLLISLFTRSGVSINSKDSDGQTPLHYAVQFHNHETVSWLLKLGADINVRNNAENTATTMCLKLSKRRMALWNIEENNIIMKIFKEHLDNLGLAGFVVSRQNKKFLRKVVKVLARNVVTKEHGFNERKI